MKHTTPMEVTLLGMSTTIDVTIHYTLHPADPGEWSGGEQISPAAPSHAEIHKIYLDKQEIRFNEEYMADLECALTAEVI